MATRNELYDAAFGHMKEAQRREDIDPAGAARLYSIACWEFEEVLKLETDKHSAALVKSRLVEFREDLRRMQQRAQEEANRAEMLAGEFDEPPPNALPAAIEVPRFPMRSVSVDHGRATTRHRQMPPSGSFARPPASSGSRTSVPLPDGSRSQSLSDREVQTLTESSRINNRVFQPWLEGEEKFERFDFPTPWVDPDGQPSLSFRQQQHGARWKRPRDFLPASVTPVMVGDLDPLSITQELVTDCSFVASLCIGAALEGRKGNRIITGNIFPQQNGMPVYNPSGKYMVRLWYNGIARKVLVDDHLPVDKNNRLLCSSASGGRELWVSIMEKAYMKLHGGYNFPGSNSGIDLFALSGWIPEQMFFTEDSSSSTRGLRTASNRLDHRQPEERAWERLYGAHQGGDCLITISTGGFASPTSQQATSTGLIRGHAYAVLDVQVALVRGEPLRMVKIKNPWSRSRWEGRFGAGDAASWTPELERKLRYNRAQALKEDNGVFWMEFTDIREHFRSFNVNWNPKIFRFHQTLHDKWSRVDGHPNDRYILGSNPQYSIRVPWPGKSGISPLVWVLVSRHTTQVESETEGAFLAVLTYKDTGCGRVYNRPRPYISDVYSNDPHHLVRIDVEFKEPEEEKNASDMDATYTIVLSQNTESQGRQLLDVNYTIHVYSSSDFEFSPTPQPPIHRNRLQSNWNPSCPGGNPNDPTYGTSPMWSLRLTEQSLCHFELRVPPEIAVQIAIFGGDLGGQRLERFSSQHLVADSKDYAHAFTFLDFNLPPGTYTIVAGRFQSGPAGTCILDVCTNVSTASVIELPRA